MNASLARAIDLAKEHIPIQKFCAKRKYWVGFTVALHNGRYSVYNADAWDRPSEVPMLPWSPPEGTKVAHVTIDGAVELLPDEPREMSQ